MALIDKASLLMVPSVYEDGTLYNVLPSGNKAPDETGNHNGYDQTRADFSFSRGANLAATRVNASGLIEKGRENLLLRSNQFDTTWVNSNTTETSGQSGYDGTNDAWLLTAIGSPSAQINQNKSFSGVHTFSVYAKAGTADFVELVTIGGGGANPRSWFNLSTGSVGTSYNCIDTKIEAVSGGWYRCSITLNANITNYRVYLSDSDNSTAVTIGNYIVIQDAQLEAGLVATDYIETTTTTAKAGVLENMPRIDYSSGAGALLLEPLRTNLLAYSEYYDAGQWANTDVDLTTNYALSPEGKMNASLWEFTTTNTLARIQYVLGSVTIGATYTQSYYIKSLSGDLTLRIGTSGAIVGEFEDITATSEWQRFDFTSVASGTTEYPRIQNISGTQGAQILVYGAQMELGSHVSSYIPTHGAAVTRVADSCSVTGVSDVIGQSEGTFYWEGTLEENPSGANMQFALSDGTTSQQIKFVVSSSSTYVAAEVKNGGVQQFYNNHNIDAKTNRKYAIAYKANDFAFYIDGTQIATDTSGSVPACTKISFDNGSSANGVHGVFKNLMLFNERLSNTELADLTS